jgi:Domain of unknown function (DUF3883)
VAVPLRGMGRGGCVDRDVASERIVDAKVQGLKNDVPTGKFKFLTSGGVPHEIFNFLPHKGHCYGYAPVGNGTVNITNLGASKGASKVSNILVVWTATHPAGGRFVVGWYRNATVYRDPVKRPSTPETKVAGQIHYNAAAAEGDCHLVPVDQRVFSIPTMQPGYPGIAPSFFPAGTAPQAWVTALRRYVFDNQVTTPPEQTSDDVGHPVDVDFKAMIEKAAVDIIVAHYAKQGFAVNSREKDNIGWDLEARRGSILLRLEVKGLSGIDPAVEVTPNEYAAMTSKKYRTSYRVCIVSRPHKPKETKIWICNYDQRIGEWVSLDLEPMNIAERVAARLSL